MNIPKSPNRFIQVKLLNGFKQTLTYKVPPQWQTADLVGAIVQVPVRNATMLGVVEDLVSELAFTPQYIIKEALSIEQMPADPYYQPFIKQLASYYRLDSTFFSRRLKQFLAQKEVKEYVQEAPTSSPDIVTLTDEQQKVVDFCLPHITTPTFTPVVVHGVTGSGKTEVYKKLIEHAHKENKSVIFLLPEVTLATSFEHLFKQQLSQIPIFGFHSATSVKDKKFLWQSLIAQKPLVIIGVHLPILLPIANLGLIIVDEEHEVGFQEKKHPKINSKEAALYRAKIAGIPIVLGSATPTLSTLYNVKHKGWHFFQLLKRFSGTFPTIKIALLSDKKQRRQFWITKQLQDAIAQQLERKEQTIIFINRRGYSFFVQCKECSFIFQCQQCSVSLTLHASGQLICHYCGFSQQQPPACPQCKKTSSFIKKGIGTQQAVEILQTMFPHARIARADMDATVNKKEWRKTMQDMKSGEIDILVGTQTITKGYHFPRVTLVGVLWADLNLNFPIFNAGETALAQLIQVAGRAGRSSQSSSVIIQTMMDHSIFKFIHEIDYLKFFDTELEHRVKLGYPPYKRLVELELKHDDEKIIEYDANTLTDKLIELATTIDLDIQILGPAKPPIYKIKNSHRMKIYIKGLSLSTIFNILDKAKKLELRSSLFITPGPLSI